MTEPVIGRIMLGVLGQVLLVGQSGTFEMKIDYLSGAFIRLKEIVTPACW